MDTDLLLEDACRLLQTMVDVISSNGWLKPALVVMEMSQMTVQGLWGEDSPLLQIPHFTPELVDKCSSASVPKRGEDGEEEEGPVESVYDVLELDASVRESLLGLSKPQVCAHAQCPAVVFYAGISLGLLAAKACLSWPR
jgi:pre-mRNA-splicing helicase BRR2